MKTLIKELRTSIVSTVFLGIILCGFYPVLVWGISQLVFPHQANGSLIEKNGQIVGSELLGQSFSGAKYFHPRPSQAGTGYDDTSSSGSNLGPTSQKLMDSIKANIATYRTENNLPSDAMAPADAVTSSASGLDPHISVSNAQLQISRVAKERLLSQEIVAEQVKKATSTPLLGFIGGDPAVNVLTLNLALDGMGGKEKSIP